MNKYIRLLLFTLIGAALGYAWYYFYGCKNGCPLTSSWVNMSIYGGLFGLIAGFPTKKQKTQDKE